jgi:hypothetical protein
LRCTRRTGAAAGAGGRVVHQLLISAGPQTD